MPRVRKIKNRRRVRISGPLCVYCGDTATTDEHFPPAACGGYGLILPACLECNSLAGTEWPFDFLRRCEHVQGGLRSRYRRVLKWEDGHDLVGVDYSLADMVLQWRKLKILINKRIAWDAMLYIASIDHSNDFVRIVADNGTFKIDEGESPSLLED